MSRRQWHDHHSTAPALHFRRADDRVLGIVSSLHDHVRTQKLNECKRGVFRKNYHEIHAFESGNYVATFGVGAHRTSWSL